MAKFFGKIGFIETSETRPGVWTEQVVEREYYGDLLRNSKRWSASSNSINDNLNISNQISIVADPYAVNNFHSMKYVKYMDACWKISDVEVEYPRLVLTAGGVYNGETAETT